MSSPDTRSFLPPYLVDRRLLNAWHEAGHGHLRPTRIEVLKRKGKSTVYRLHGTDGGRSTLIAKRCRAATAGLERLIHEEVLARLPVRTLRCHGCSPEPDGEHAWLFLEDAGSDLYSPMNASDRALAGRWLGMTHALSLTDAERALLPDRGPSYYLSLLRLSRASLLARASSPDLNRAEARLLKRLVLDLDRAEARWPLVEAIARDWPGALVHGDFAAKNLRVRPAATPVLLVLDWEMAGWGLPAADLAQSLGKCASPDLENYRSSLGRATAAPGPGELRRLAEVGALLRLVHKISWEIQSMEDALCVLALYEPQMRGAVHALQAAA